MRKMTALVAGSIGYVLGARAGRQRYEQIKSAALRVRSNPKVQQTAQQVADAAKEAAPVVKEKLTDVAGAATSKGTSPGDDATTASTDVPMETSAYPLNDEDAKNP